MAEGGQESRGGNEDTVGIKALSVLHPFLLILSTAARRIGRGEGVLPPLVLLFFFNLHSPLKVIGELSLSSTEAQMSHMESWIAIAPASSPAFILPLPSSHAVWPSRFVSGHLLQRAQGDTWLLRHRWVAVSPASWRPPVGPLSLFPPL